MSVTRINMIEFDYETVANARAAEYQNNARKQFPDADLLIAIRTSPTSAMTISVYPNEETVERALEMRAQRMVNEKMFPVGTLKSKYPLLTSNKTIA